MRIKLDNDGGAWIPGTYLAEITSCRPKVARNTGRDCLEFKFHILDDGFTGDQTIYHTTVISGPGQHHLCEILRAAGHEPRDGAFDTEDLIEKKLLLSIGLNEIPQANGKPNPYPQVKDVLPCNEAEVSL